MGYFLGVASIKEGVIDNIFARYGAINRGERSFLPRRFDFPNLSIIVTAPGNAPVSSFCGENGGGVFLLGDVYDLVTTVSPAETLAQKFSKQGKEGISALNGYYIAVACDPENGVTIASDTLGLFPIYYFSDGKALIFTDHPGMLRVHPAFDARLSIGGLIGTLLTMHPVDNQTLLTGVRRLPAGYVLNWDRGQVREIKTNILDFSTKYFDEPHALQLERADAIVQRAIRRVCSTPNVRLLLSGGLDSRLIAGYLSLLSDVHVSAVTMGSSNDLEYRCASGVVKTLGWPSTRCADDMSRCGGDAVQQLSDEVLSCGFNEVTWLQLADHLHQSDAPLITGLYGGSVMGAYHIDTGYDKSVGAYTFDKIFSTMNRWGFAPDTIKQLVRSELLGYHLDQAVDSLRSQYEAFPGQPFQKSWQFDLYFRERFHISGAGWRLAKGTWARHPLVDKELLELCASTSKESLRNRKLQVDLLCKKFPNLARLPIDRNSYNTEPLRPGLKYKLIKRFNMFFSNGNKTANHEHRYYYRVFDINNQAWRVIREMAEEHRSHLYEIFNPDVLNAMLPAPHEKITLRDGIHDASGLKILIGLMLLAGNSDLKLSL